MSRASNGEESHALAPWLQENVGSCPFRIARLPQDGDHDLAGAIDFLPPSAPKALAWAERAETRLMTSSPAPPHSM